MQQRPAAMDRYPATRPWAGREDGWAAPTTARSGQSATTTAASSTCPGSPRNIRHVALRNAGDVELRPFREVSCNNHTWLCPSLHEPAGKAKVSPTLIDACVENDPLRKAERLETQAPVGRLPLISYASVNKPGIGCHGRLAALAKSKSASCLTIAHAFGQ